MGPVAQSVASPIADPGVLSPCPIHTLIIEIDHEIFPTPSVDSRRIIISYNSYKQNYVHEVLFNRFVKLAQENVW